MKNLIVFSSLFLFMSSCTLGNEVDLKPKIDYSLNDVNIQEDSSSPYYVLSKVPSDKSNLIRDEINKLNDENSDISISLSLILLGKKGSIKDQYLLIRKFNDVNEADNYINKISLNPIVQNIETIKILSQEKYREFVRKSSQ